MIYTSYFGALPSIMKYDEDNNPVPITICGKAPDGWKGLQYKKLAPKYDFFMKWKENHDNDEYVKHFEEEVLSKLDPVKVLEDLYNLSDGKDVVLICYETPEKFCHRHIVSAWFREHEIPCFEFSVIQTSDMEIDCGFENNAMEND